MRTKEQDRQLLENIFRDLPEVEPTGLQDLIEQLIGYERELKSELIRTPYLFFKARWQLNAKLVTTQSILKIANRINTPTHPQGGGR